jgi:hypothetical protein
MAGLKVRLDDGSEVGPLDLRMMQTWYQQGLIGPEAMVQKPGSPRWVRLSEAADLREWGPAPMSKAGGARSRAAAEPDSFGEMEEGRWRLYVAAALFFVLAVGSGLCAFFNDRVRPELDGAPWLQIALGLGALGLALVRGWDWGRRIVRIVALLTAAAAFPLAGVFIAKGLRGEALWILAFALLLAAGLAAFLAPSLSRLASAASLLLVLLGGAGLVRYVPAEAGADPAVALWTSPERRVANDEMGLALALPEGWALLKPGNSLVKAPPAGKASFAQPRVSGYAFLLVEPAPPNVLLLEHYLDHVIAQRRAGALSFDEDWRRDGRLGSVASRRGSTRRSSSEGRFVERTVVARDGDLYFALVAWVPEAGGGRAIEEIDSLETAVSLSGVRDAARRRAVEGASLELPQLSLGAIQKLVESGGPGTPAELFCRSLVASARGLQSLGPAGAQELQGLTAQALDTLPKKERAQLAEYLGHVAADQPTQPQEDEQMRVLMKAAAARLVPARRDRLGELYEVAIRRGLGESP